MLDLEEYRKDEEIRRKRKEDKLRHLHVISMDFFTRLQYEKHKLDGLLGQQAKENKLKREGFSFYEVRRILDIK